MIGLIIFIIAVVLIGSSIALLGCCAMVGYFTGEKLEEKTDGK